MSNRKTLEYVLSKKSEVVNISVSIGDQIKINDTIFTRFEYDYGYFLNIKKGPDVPFTTPITGTVTQIHINIGDEIKYGDSIISLVEVSQRYCVVTGRTISILTAKVNDKMDKCWMPQGNPFKGGEATHGVVLTHQGVNQYHDSTNIWCQAMIFTKE